MSILVKGMKMPKTCNECDFCYWSNLHQTGMCDRCDDEPVCADFGTDYKKTRARFCPLVEIPPHVKFVNVDALGLRDIEIIMCEGSYKEALKMLIDKIEHATPIETERMDN